MKVLILSDFFLSGQTTHVLDLAKQLQKLNINVHLNFGTIHTKLFNSHYAPNLQAQEISFSQGKDLSNLYVNASRWRPDIIHCQSSTLFKLAQILAFRLNIPYVLTCHGLGFRHPKYKSQLKAADAIVAIGPIVAEEVQEYSSKVIIIPNGIDTDHFKPPSQGDRRRRKVLYAGRIEKRRIEALQYLIDAHHTILGQPLTIVADWNPKLPNTNFIPWQIDLRTKLQEAGIVAACGRTAREALSCGNAVLLMQQAYSGVISPQLAAREDFNFSGNQPRFSLQTIEKDLRRLLRSYFRLSKLQSWGRQYALENLSSLEMAKKTLALYQRLI